MHAAPTGPNGKEEEEEDIFPLECVFVWRTDSQL
jgi:hypothetical protein